MSDRGSILISTANDIGEALVEKLGGEGYAPSVWDKEYNKLGIAEVDSAPALSVLEDSSETGTARGSILLSTANKIGAVLNKKYRTDRGFKPKEWASAASKLAPLPEKSAESSPVCSIEDGADDVPSRSLVVTISPTLTGISEVVETQTEKTIFYPTDIEQGSISSNGSDINSTTRIRTAERKAVTPSTKYKIKVNSEVQIYEVHEYTDLTGTSTHLTVNASEYTFTTNSTTNYIRVLFRYPNNATITPSAITEIQVTDEWKTYTADLGRTINGGTADIVNGVGTDEYVILSLAVADMNNSENYPGWRNCGVREIIGAEVSSSVTDGVSTVGQYWSYNTLGSNDILYLPRGQYNNMTQSDWINTYPDLVIQFVIKKATATAFTFDGQEIPTRDGYNAFWSDQGNTALDYYGEPEPYTRGTASGAIANVQSARTDLPFTKVKANIAPNLTGVESVEVTKCGVNLFDKTAITPNTWIIVNSTSTEASNSYSTSDYIPVSAGKRYFVSFKDSNRSAYYDRNKNGIEYFSFNGNASFTALYDGYIRVTIKNDINLDTFIINEGNDEATYEQYNKTTYTADLGEPVYGGYADLVSGTGLKICGKIIFNGSENWSAYTTGNGYAIPLTGMERGTWYTSPLALSYPLPKVPNNDNLGVRIGVNNDGIYVVQANTIDGVTDLTSFKAWLAENPLTIIYPLDVTTEFTFDGQVISPSEGVNNLWNNAGGDTDVEYFEQE